MRLSLRVSLVAALLFAVAPLRAGECTAWILWTGGADQDVYLKTGILPPENWGQHSAYETKAECEKEGAIWLNASAAFFKNDHPDLVLAGILVVPAATAKEKARGIDHRASVMMDACWPDSVDLNKPLPKPR